MHTALKKAVRIGRAAALAIGVGVMVALLVLGVATVALAAVPGDPFRLGQLNVINNATTALQGNGPSGIGLGALLEVKRDGVNGGPALRVQNTSTGIGASGIRVDVAQNKAPISVNSGAGKASFLNVDRIDGKDSSEFLPNDTYVNVVSRQGPGGGGTVFASADCDSGDKLLGGGGQALSPTEDDTTASLPFIEGQGWDYQIQDNGDSSFVDAFVLCADFPPQH